MTLWNCRKPAGKDGTEMESGPKGQPPKNAVEKELLEHPFGKSFGKREPRGARCAQRCLGALKGLGLSIRTRISHFGEDWIFLFLLGIAMATLSFGLDIIVSKFQQGGESVLWVFLLIVIIIIFLLQQAVLKL